MEVLSTFAHARLVNGLRWSPDGRFLASGSADRTCVIWEPQSGARVAVLARHTDDVNSMAWSADGTRLATVSEDGTGRLWDVRRGWLLDGLMAHGNHVMSVDWNHSTDVIATCGEDATIRVWSREGRRIAEWPQPGDLEMIRWSPKFNFLAATCDDGYVRILDGSGELIRILGPHHAAVKSVSWSPDQRRIAIGAYDSTCRIYDVESGQVLATFEGAGLWPRAIHWSPSSPHLAIGTTEAGPAVVAIPESGGAPVIGVSRAVPTHGINSVASVGDRGVLLGADDGSAHFWDLSTMEERMLTVDNELSGGSLVNSVAFDGDRDLAALGTFSGLVSVFRLGQKKCVGTVSLGQPINQVAFSPHGSLAAADYEGRVTVLGTGDSGLEIEREIHAHEGAVKSVVWLDDRRLVTGSTDRLVKVISRDGKELHSMSGHGNLVNSVSVTQAQGAELVASASRDRTVRVWDVASGRCLQVLLGHDESVKSVAFKPGSSTVLLTGSYDFDGRLWNLDSVDAGSTGSKPLRAHRHAVGATTWWRDMPVTASWDTRCIVWNPETGRPVRTLALADAL